MEPSKPMNFRQKHERGTDFLRYLETENIQIDGMNKEQIKSHYDHGYMLYRRQIYPDEKRINFATILFTLTHTSFVRLHGKKVYLGHVPRNRPSRRQNHPRPEHASSAARQSPEETSRTKPRRKRRKKPTTIAVDQHMILKQSESITKASGVGLPTEKKQAPDAQGGNIFECHLCVVKCHSYKEYQLHLQGKRHRLKVITTELRKNKNKMTQDKEGVEIKSVVSETSEATSADTVTLELREGDSKGVIFRIENKSKEDLFFLRCETLKRVRVFTVYDEKKVTDGMKQINIPPGYQYEVTVKTKVSQVGTYHSPVAFQFKRPSNSSDSIYIIRFLCLRVTNDIVDDLGPTEEYRKPPRVSGRRGDEVEIIDGVRPPKFEADALEKIIQLDMFLVPINVRKMANRGLEESSESLSPAEVEELRSLRLLMEKPLDEDTYDERFAYLLNFEEIQMEVDVRRYDMEDVTMKRCPGNRKCLLLEVPGLAENRPSVLKGDSLYVRIQNSGKPGTKEYKGYVHEVQQNKVALGFHQSLMHQYVANMKFNVRFTVNRLPLRLQHRAVKLAVELSLKDIISPSLKTACTRGTIIPPNEPLRFYNSKIEENPQQMQAVRNIVAGTSRPAPYIVFGPPGTGKTVTIVEAMKQVIRCIPTAHILACAPSNSSVDVITERLLEHLPKSQVFRMLASTRPWIAVKDSIKGVCNYNKMCEQYYYPNKEELMKYKVVACTLVTAGRIASASFPSDHFTHVFVDEAGCAVEPECIVPVAGVMDCLPEVKDGGQLVLAGDPKQLGPILRSPYALHYGLGISLLERYMTQCDVYARKDDGESYDPRVLTKLVNNYRSHPKLLEMPNNTFYHGELVPKADPVVINAFCQWKGLPKPGFPIIFHGVEGEDMREERSPSFFNPIEACIVLDYVKQLTKGDNRGMKVKQSHIGVISPYRKQVQKMRNLFGKQGWSDIKVGTVEEFQGDERVIIIVTTVRSKPDLLEMDEKFNLGFLDNPKRFNVAITRTRALLIVVGNPLILSRDPCWNNFLEFCHSNGGYTGMPYGDIEAFMEDILQRLSHLGLKG